MSDSSCVAHRSGYYLKKLYNNNNNPQVCLMSPLMFLLSPTSSWPRADSSLTTVSISICTIKHLDSFICFKSSCRSKIHRIRILPLIKSGSGYDTKAKENSLENPPKKVLIFSGRTNKRWSDHSEKRSFLQL